MSKHHWLKVVFGLAVVLILIPVWGGSAMQARQEAEAKIEPALVELFTAQGASDFLVVFAEQADLSPAEAMDWESRGEFVYKTLTETAERSQATAKKILDEQGLKHQTFIAGNELYVWSGDQSIAQNLASLPEVAQIRVPITATIEPAIFAEPAISEWNIMDTGAYNFRSTFLHSGEGIRVAHLGTGAYPFHPALQTMYGCGSNYSDPSCWYDPSNICGGSACDSMGVSTQHIGIMVGEDYAAHHIGMAPGAKWIACKACETGSCSTTAVNACADWVLAPGGDPAKRPHIAHVAFYYGGCNDVFKAKVIAWRAAGIFPSFGAGNGGPTCGAMSSPGDYQESFASGAHDDTRTIASFSGRGPSCYGHDPYTKPNISAPGVAVETSNNDGGFITVSGTNFAAAHSAGAVALLWSCNPGLIGRIDLTFEILQDHADVPPAGSCGVPPDTEGNYTYGYGYLDVFAAGEDYCNGAWFQASSVPFDLNRYDCIYLDDGSGQSVYNQKVYCMGGRTTSSTESPDIWRYDPLTDLWQDTLVDMPEDVSNYTANLLKDENYATNGLGIYVVGGNNIDGGGVVYTYAQRYYPKNNIAEVLTADPVPFTVGGSAANPGACVHAKGKIYCFGGFINSTAPYYSAETWEYDPFRTAGSRWLRITSADLHVPRGYIQAVTYQGKIYAMGGDYQYIGGDIVPTTTVEVLNADNLTAGWQLLSPMPVASGQGRVFAWKGKLYVVGGGDWPSRSAEAMEYDIASNTWNQDFPDLITARRNHAGAVIPICTANPADGLPGMWVFGGNISSDNPPFGEPEYFIFACKPIYLPVIIK